MNLRPDHVFWLSLLLLSCATSRHAPIDSTILKGVPYYNQEAYQCGPASLASVLNYWYEGRGVSERVTPEAIGSEIYSPTARGVLGFDLERYARKRGFSPRQFTGTFEALTSNINAGNPPIILVDYGFGPFQQGHFMVVTGYASGGIVVNSGARRDAFVTREELERIWKKTGFWTLVVTP
jgi:ABC-type bacteriocin/lantibiotic exporter with double-glycine peptidase domain